MSFNKFWLDTFAVHRIFSTEIKSIASEERVNVRFINKSPDIVDLCWVDFEGKLVRYLKLGQHETARINTFVGHCWIARYIRNGAPAHFLPERREVFVASSQQSAGPVIVLIVSKVPTLFEAVVEYLGEFFYGRQEAVDKLPLPRTIKERLYSKEEIYKILRNDDHKQLFEVFSNGQTDLCLSAVSDLSIEYSDFKISEAFLTHLRKEFAVMGSSTVYNYAKKWIDFISQTTAEIRTHCLLLRQLIISTDLLQNKQLQEMLQEGLPRTYSHLCSTMQYSAASIIAEIMFYAIAVQAVYLDDCDRDALLNIWKEFSSSNESRKLAHCKLCTVLVMISLSFDCTSHIQILLESALNDVEDSSDLLFSPKRQFFTLLEANLGAVLTRCSAKQSEQLFNALIIFHLENNSLNLLVRKIFSHPELINTYSSQVLKQFFRCLLLILAADLNQNLSQQDENIGEWIKNSVEGILDKSAENYENEIDSWKSIFSGLIPVPPMTTLAGSRSEQIIQTLCEEECLLEALPVSMRLAVFCCLISLISSIPLEIFDLAMKRISLIAKSETKLFRTLLSSCKGNVLKKYIRALLRSGCSSDTSKNAQIVAEEFLISSGTLTVLFVKCNGVLKDCAQQSSAKEQFYYLKPVCDVLYEIHYKTEAEESDTLRIYVEKVFRCVYELASPVDCSNASKMAIFELALSLLLVVQILRNKSGTISEEESGSTSIAEHAEIADQLCKTICKHPERLTGLGLKSEQMSQLLKTSITWMIKRGKLKRIMSWKYAKNYELYDEAVIREVISSSSVEMLQGLLQSSLDKRLAMKKFAFYSALAKHKNEKKRKLLSAVLIDVLDVVTDVASADYFAAICFLQHILPTAAGSGYEKDFVSFALTVLATNSQSLATNPHALRNAVALLWDCLRFGAHSVNDQCSLYANLFVDVVRAVQKYASNSLTASPQLIRHLAYGLAKIAHAMVKHERSFSRIAPFIISDCLDDVKCTSFALLRVFSLCDRYSIALLTTNLPPLQKARFAHLCPQYTKINKTIA